MWRVVRKYQAHNGNQNNVIFELGYLMTYWKKSLRYLGVLKLLLFLIITGILFLALMADEISNLKYAMIL